jgi:hypothetical protein
MRLAAIAFPFLPLTYDHTNGAETKTANPRPKVIIILANDIGYGDPQCFNSESKINTPHIDRLARERMRFTNAHSPSALCVPTRYGLLTGHYPVRTWTEKDGSKLAEYSFSAPVSWDGMAAAGRHLYLSTVDGRLVCMASVHKSSYGAAAVID